MAQRYRVSGTLSYLNEKNQRLAIPLGTIVELEELEGDNPAAVLRWKDESGSAREQALSTLEWAEYKKRSLRPVD